MSDKENAESNDTNTHLIIPTEVLPDVLPIIPVSHRPLFPGMMIPMVLSGDRMLASAREIIESESKVGGAVLIRNQHDGPMSSDDLYAVGTSIKIVKVTPMDEKTIQVMITAIKRFTLAQALTDEPVTRWRVHHNYEEDSPPTEDMKAYSMAIIS
ncbi:MAG: hypothetical protein EHM32_02800, partial [Spirochaetales bacterium]